MPQPRCSDRGMLTAHLHARTSPARANADASSQQPTKRTHERCHLSRGHVDGQQTRTDDEREREQPQRYRRWQPRRRGGRGCEPRRRRPRRRRRRRPCHDEDDNDNDPAAWKTMTTTTPPVAWKTTPMMPAKPRRPRRERGCTQLSTINRRQLSNPLTTHGRSTSP